MREKIHLGIRYKHIALLPILVILLFSNIFIVSSPVYAQEEELIIDVTNDSYEEIDEIYEEEDFFVSVYTLGEGGVPDYQIGVEIEFDGKTYQITAENPEITLKAPQVSENTIYTIRASKSGYAPVEKNITILNKLKLIVTLDKYTVKANERFSVVVKDENENPVKDATVYIQSVLGESDTTNEDGRAWLVAPEDRTEITVIVRKEGYQDKTTTVMIDIPLGLWESLLQNPYTPIVIAIILLILAIVFVNLRQKKLIDIGTKKTSKEQPLRRYGGHGAIVSPPSSEKTGKPINQHGLKKDVQVEPKWGSKVEEIRISRPRKDKEIVPVKSEKEEARKIIPRRTIRKYDYDWFEGTDDIRYEVDKITGEIDEEGVDKWFEGIDDIRAKIDEKVKKKDKRKDE